MVDVVLAEVGIVWVPEYYVAHHLKEGQLIHLLPEGSPSALGTCLCYPANRHPPAALRFLRKRYASGLAGHL
ncbi:LysR substrate-binding domain-containing protein [Silvimonas terrae]|uniref:LysR substrate-binding domain-containing protein n=1 Tax=Silvimonas terrae TaxID=300266 RepID=UPI001C861522